MKLLAADTSTSSLSVAICGQDLVYAEATVECDRRHTERLLATVDWVLRESSLALGDMDALAVTVGPGSFTGLRVGLAALKGLALGASLPLVGVPTLDAMARLAGATDGFLCPLLDAKMGEVFGAGFESVNSTLTKRIRDKVCSIDAFLEETPPRATYLGDGALLYRDQIERLRPESTILGTLFRSPRATAVAMEAFSLMQRGLATTDPDGVVPVYLRVSQAEQARAKAGGK